MNERSLGLATASSLRADIRNNPTEYMESGAKLIKTPRGIEVELTLEYDVLRGKAMGAGCGSRADLWKLPANTVPLRVIIRFGSSVNGLNLGVSSICNLFSGIYDQGG